MRCPLQASGAKLRGWSSPRFAMCPGTLCTVKTTAIGIVEKKLWVQQDAARSAAKESIEPFKHFSRARFL
jgi:hypothetical protein